MRAFQHLDERFDGCVMQFFGDSMCVESQNVRRAMFIAAIHSICLENGDKFDAVQLGDGRVVVMDGERAIFFENMGTLLVELICEAGRKQRPSLALR